MIKVSLKLPEDLYKKLEDRTKNKGEENVSQTIRDLIDLGLRVEAAAEKNQGEVEGSNLIDEIRSIKDMLEFNMTWALEGRTYARYLVEKIPDATEEKNIELANMIKEKAKQNIKEKHYRQGKP